MSGHSRVWALVRWQSSSARVPGSVIPPPLVRGGQQAASKLGPQASAQVVMPPLVRGAQVSSPAWPARTPVRPPTCPPARVQVSEPALLSPAANPHHPTAFQHWAAAPPPGAPGLGAQRADPGPESHPAGPHPRRQRPQCQPAGEHPTGEGGEARVRGVRWRPVDGRAGLCGLAALGWHVTAAALSPSALACPLSGAGSSAGVVLALPAWLRRAQPAGAGVRALPSQRLKPSSGWAVVLPHVGGRPGAGGSPAVPTGL